MKKFILPIFMGFILVSSSLSCSKDSIDSYGPDQDLSTELSATESAQKQFASILSKAVAENESLRSFLKSTALEEFDLDYDVFYPFVKDNEVVPAKSFRNLLLEYCDESTLSDIEEKLPKLNILVPDWAWLGGFSVNEWDTSRSDVAVSFVSENDYVEVFDKGESVGKLPDGSIPDFPMLVIKSNERIKYTPGTKGQEGQYEFIDEAFRNVQTKVQHQYYEITVDGVPDVSNFVPDDQINYRVKQAYSYFPSGPSSIYQRDYLYFNMTGPDQAKPQYDNIWEKIYKFKFKSFNIPALFDVSADNLDKSHIQDGLQYEKNRGDCSVQGLRNFFYAEGNLELHFLISIPYNTGGCFRTEKVVSVNFCDAFAISHVDLDYRHRTWFCRDWYVYSVNDYTDVLPKWCVVNLDLPRWKISQTSSVITISVSEFDETGVSEYTYKTTHTAGLNFIHSSQIGMGNWKVGLGVTTSYSDSYTTTEKYTRNQGGVDNLGQADLVYNKPVILNQTSKNGVSGYDVNTISTGDLDIMVLPYSY